MKIKFIILCLLPLFTMAQPFKFKSKGTAKPIELSLGWQNNGKAAYVMYKGKKEAIALQLKSLAIDSTERKNGQPDEDTYVWQEIYKGKITGEYGVKIMLRNIYDMYYIRFSDKKRFDFDYIERKGENYNGKAMALLHGVQIHYNVFYDDNLLIKYADGSTQKTTTTGLPDGDVARYVNVADYNFDGLDDIAFSVPDAGHGVYRIFNIWLYNPTSKKFNLLAFPKAGKMQCNDFCDVKILKKVKQLSSSCKGGPQWFTDYYQYDKNGKLVWLKTTEGEDNLFDKH